MALPLLKNCPINDIRSDFVERGELSVWPSITVTCEGEAYLEDFDDEEIIEYLRRKGYGVSKGGPDDADTIEKMPLTARNFDEYAREFCKLNNLWLVGMPAKQ